MLTRAADQAGPWRAALQAAGARVVEVPCIAIAPGDPAEMREALGLPTEWGVLTSPNGARAVAAALGTAEPPWRRLAVVGPGTAAAAAAAGWRVDLQPRQADGAGLADLLVQAGYHGSAVLVARGDLAHDDLPARLRKAGALVHEVVAYRTVADPALSGRLAAALAEGPPDWVVLASGSAFMHLHAAWPGGLVRVKLAAIGPRTADVVRAAGLVVAAQAVAPTAEALVAALGASPA